jgi:hypothetical protein
MKFKQTIAKVVILVASLSIGVLLCEAGSRLILNPVVYLSAMTIRDNVIGIVIVTNNSGFDGLRQL